jgi:ATP-binding cassette subfamily F protein 3
LDINSREILEDALSGYEGTLLVVSHDRYFIDKLATRIIDIGTTPAIDCFGNYTYFIEHYKKNVASARKEQPVISEAKQSHLATKEERSRIRKLEKQLSDTEKAIDKTETRLKELEEEMVRFATDHEKLLELNEEQQQAQHKLEELYEVWSEVTEQLEA